MKIIYRFFFPILLIGLLSAACDDNGAPLAPVTGGAVPVTAAAQIEGRWGGLHVLANGLPAGSYTLPALVAAGFAARISSWNSDLVLTRTGETGGLFSVLTRGTASDTVASGLSAHGEFGFWGDFVLRGEGEIAVTPRAGDSRDRAFHGTAALLADTLVVGFTLAAPPEKALAFLPDTVVFIARLVRR